MDKTWMTKPKWTHEYLQGVDIFLDFANRKKNSIDQILCPCKICINRYFHTLNDVKYHLLGNGIFPGYVLWNRHGEEYNTMNEAEQVLDQNEQHNSGNIDELLRDINDTNYIPEGTIDENPETEGIGSNDAEKFKKLLEDAGNELYPGCKSFSKLSFILQLFRLKCLNSWTAKSFDLLLELLVSAFPEGTLIPKNTYEVKKILKVFDLGYKKIHACPNDCMLFWGDKADQDICQNCGSSRWAKTQKNTEVQGKKGLMKAAKIIRYFPLIPRLQRLFKVKETAEEMIWHDKYRNKDGLLRHPADGEAWKFFDSKYPDFASDPRNIRLGLASDGFNPYKIMSSTYSIWPVIIIPYNLPPWIGMKQNSFLLSTLIPGEKSPGNNIDIYLQPLIQELQQLWIGVQCYDASKNQNFNLRAALLWTINDFPAYGMLSGWSTKGRFACPCCVENTESLWLYKSKKFSYMGHRRWLPDTHIFRRQKHYFDNKVENRSAPQRCSGSQILTKVKNLQFTFGATKRDKIRKRKSTESSSEPIIWKKKSIFFELSYWEHNLLPRNLDVILIEKNVYDNFIGTLLDQEKSKDNL